MHRRIVLSKSLAPFVAVAIFPATATARSAGLVVFNTPAGELTSLRPPGVAESRLLTPNVRRVG
jgi:hypothetical protein